MDIVTYALVQKAVKDAHVDHVGPKGDKGDPLTWDDLTEEQKASLVGPKGDKGDPGVTENVDAVALEGHKASYFATAADLDEVKTTADAANTKVNSLKISKVALWENPNMAAIDKITNFTFPADDSYSLAILEYVGALSEDIPLTTILCKGSSHPIICQYSDGIGVREVLLEDGILSVGQIYGTNSNVSDSYLIPKALYKLVIE